MNPTDPKPTVREVDSADLFTEAHASVTHRHGAHRPVELRIAARSEHDGLCYGFRFEFTPEMWAYLEASNAKPPLP